MSKTIVNIIDKGNPLPAYLFTKEVYSEGDRLLFISTREEADSIELLKKQLQIPDDQVDSIIIKHDNDKVLYERICRIIKNKLDENQEYYVNLAGGSRYMALSVQHVFEEFQSVYFYTQTRENIIVKTIFDNSIYDDDDEIFPINYRMSLREYFELYGLEHDLDVPKATVQNASFAQHMFVLFSKKLLSNSDYQVLDILRKNYRNWNSINIAEVEQPEKFNMTAIPNLSKTLDYIGFIPKNNGVLMQDELEYLTGGWFEEYVFYMVNSLVKPEDIAIGVHISSNGMKHNNELDVSFIKANKLFVIECKTGVSSESLFNEIVYKVCAIKEVLLGTCNSYIFSLKNDFSGDWKKIANYMDISFCDYDIMTTKEMMKGVVEEIIKIAGA